MSGLNSIIAVAFSHGEHEAADTRFPVQLEEVSGVAYERALMCGEARGNRTSGDKLTDRPKASAAKDYICLSSSRPAVFRIGRPVLK